jgi:hypothetical protein
MANPIEFARDRAAEQIKYASSTVSQNARTIGIGLALVLYSLAFGEDKRGWLDVYRTPLIAAAAFGIACVVLDYLQYYFTIWENRSVLGTLEQRKQEIISLSHTDAVGARQLAVNLLASADKLSEKSIWARLREACFHLKFAAAVAGVGMMVFVMWQVLNAPPVKVPMLPG